MAQINKLLDTNRKVVFKFTGNAPEGRTLKIDAGSLFGALNATGVLLASDATNNRKPQYRMSLKSIWYDVNSGGAASGYVELSTDGDAGANTILYCSNQLHIGLNEGPEPFVIDLSQIANTTGNVFLATTGLIANGSYTIIADFRKNPLDFSAGQNVNPSDFNQGPRGV